MIHMNVKCDDLIAANILTQAECGWVTSVRIPYGSTGEMFYEKHRIDSLVTKAIADGVVSEVPREQVIIQRGPQVMSDYIDGPMGAIQNQVDGKMYDSKSQYYKAVKAAGCVVMGNDTPKEAKGPTANICEKELGRDIKQAIEQLGG